MSKAFLVLNCDLGTEEEIIGAASKRKDVSFAFKTQGVYDIIMKLESGSEDELRKCIQDIQRISNVRSSLTLVVAKG